MYYEIHISKDGQHFFATSERSIRTLFDLRGIYPVIKEKFPESEGYEITVTKWETKGHDIKTKEII